MKPYASRVGRWPIALTLIAVAAACADDPVTTAPRAPRLSREALPGNVILVTNASGGNEPGSLRWALNVASGTSVIQFDTSLAGDTIPLQEALEVFPYVTIEGPTSKGITLTRNAGSHIFRLRQGGVLRNLTISGGSDSPASAIWTLGDLLLENSTVTDNHGFGAAIHGHNITLVNSTVSGNSGVGPGSAISIASGGTLVLDNSTVAHNEGGSAIGWQNSPGGPPFITLRNSIVANNQSRNCDQWVTIVHQGMNVSNDSTCGVSSAMLVADPMLAGLADNGGPTRTEGFAPQSPALNGAVNCSVTVDQRYVSRGTSCDIGAFEFTNFTVVTLAIDANAVTGGPSGAATVTGTVACSRAGDQFSVAVDLQQEQKVGKSTTTVHGRGTTGITCSTSAQPWSVAVTPAAGTFVTGNASAAASMANIPAWVTPSSVSRAVKLVRAPRR